MGNSEKKVSVDKRNDPYGNIHKVAGMIATISRLKGYDTLSYCYDGTMLYFVNGDKIGEQLSRLALEGMNDHQLLDVLEKEMAVMIPERSETKITIEELAKIGFLSAKTNNTHMQVYAIRYNVPFTDGGVKQDIGVRHIHEIEGDLWCVTVHTDETAIALTIVDSIERLKEVCKGITGEELKEQ